MSYQPPNNESFKKLVQQAVTDTEEREIISIDGTESSRINGPNGEVTTHFNIAVRSKPKLPKWWVVVYNTYTMAYNTPAGEKVEGFKGVYHAKTAQEAIAQYYKEARGG